MKHSEIMEKMDRLAAAPMKKVPKERMAAVIEELKKKTPKSKEMFDAAQKVIPGGVEHMLSHTTPHPVFIESARGPYLFDVDGNRYIDYINGGGPVILGHNPDSVREKVEEVMKTKGWYHGLPDEYETLAAEKIVEHMPSVEKVRFFQSGTEACMAAIRVARAFTGKQKIIKFRGSYHGWSDQLVIDLWVPHSGRFMASGIPEAASANTVLVPINDPEALEAAIREQKDKGGVAAVITEPVGPESGTIPLREDFPKELERICKDNNVLLIFDEVVTGFRVSMGGAQQYYGVDPDLTVLGKIITGCFPSSGAVAGKSKIIDVMKSGIMSGGGPSAFVAGTMAASPLTSAAVYFTICELEKTDAVNRAAAMADKLVADLNKLFESRGSLWFAYNIASILHIEMSAALHIDIRVGQNLMEIFDRKTTMTDYQTFLRNEGIMTLMGKGYVTSAHSDDDIALTVKSFENLLDAL